MKKIIKKLAIVLCLLTSIELCHLYRQPILNVSADATTLSTSKVYYIRNQKSGLYMDIRGGNTDDSAEMIQYRYHGAENQQYRLESLSNGLYAIVPIMNPDVRITISGGQATNETPVTLSAKNTSNAAQQFQIVDDGNGTGSYKILTKVSNYQKAIVVKNASMNMANLIQYTYSNNGTSDNDHWYFEEVPQQDIYVAKVRIFALDNSASSSSLEGTELEVISLNDNTLDTKYENFNENDNLDPLNDGSSSITLGHAFLAVTNLTGSNLLVGLMSVTSGQNVSIGTFPDGGNVTNMENLRGIWYNREAMDVNGGPYDNAASTYIYIKQAQLNSFNTVVRQTNNDDWSIFNTCTTFAIEAWNQLGGVQFTSRLLPSSLRSDIVELENYKVGEAIGVYGRRAYVSNGGLVYV